jgi:hypothetical protein
MPDGFKNGRRTLVGGKDARRTAGSADESSTNETAYICGSSASPMPELDQSALPMGEPQGPNRCQCGIVEGQSRASLRDGLAGRWLV